MGSHTHPNSMRSAQKMSFETKFQNSKKIAVKKHRNHMPFFATNDHTTVGPCAMNSRRDSPYEDSNHQKKNSVLHARQRKKKTFFFFRTCTQREVIRMSFFVTDTYLTLHTPSTEKQTLDATTYILLESKRTGLQASELFKKTTSFGEAT